MDITVITSNYPWPEKPYCGTFVRELVWEFARQGHACTVIAPAILWDRYRYGDIGLREEIELVERSHATVRVMRPRTMTASAKRIGMFNTIDISDYLFMLAVRRELSKIKDDIDCIYAHFFYPAGRAAARCAKKWNLPYVVAHGDDDIEEWYHARGAEHFKDVACIVSVSTRNKIFCEKVFDIPSSKIKVFPNGIDLGLFYPRDRVEARRRLSLPLDARIVAFVGHFIQRKGPDRVVWAIEGIPNVKVMLIGQGPIAVKSDQMAFCGVVDHEELPWYLSAADIFVLPTTGEGSCNSIAEAMACGLPVVSSKGDFNDDILNEEVAIRVDPLSVADIRRAIESLLDDKERKTRMSVSALEWSKRFSIVDRARGIAGWMSRVIP